MDNLLISQIKLGTTTYDIKDAAARSDIQSLQSAIAGGTHFIGKTTSTITDGSTTNPVVIDSENVTAVAGDIVIKELQDATEPAIEYIFDGSKWQELGSTGHLGTLAYKSSASGSYTPSGSVSATIDATATNATLTKADYTPAGSVSVTLKNAGVLSSVATAGTLPSKSADSFTANTPTAIDTSKFNGGSKSADSFTAASMTNTSRTVATEGITASYDNEVLTLGSAGTTTASYITNFSGGSFTEGAFTPASLSDGFYTAGSAASFTEGTFNAGAMPTFNTATVSVDTASFSGTKATDALVTAVSYDKTTVSDLAFSGTQGTVTVS